MRMIRPTLSFPWLLLLPAAAVMAQQPALRGLDPVALCKGQEQPGKPELALQHGAYRYQFASADQQALFTKDPERYEIQLGGACARMGPLSGTGDAQRWLVHKERIYIFASDQCREGFRKRHDAFLAIDEPAPTDAAALAAGKALVERAALGHGGAERLRAWRSYRHERSAKNGDTTDLRRTWLQLPATARFDHDYTQGDKTWRYANVLTPATTFSLANDKGKLLGKDAAHELQFELFGEPLVALRLVLAGDALAVPAGTREVGGVAVEEFTVWYHQRTITFGIGQDGRVRTARCRGRGPGLWFATLERVYDDFQEHGGLHVPTSVRVLFDGQDVPAMHERREKIVVDGELPDGLFTAPK